MDNKLINALDKKIEESRGLLTELLIQLVNIKSVKGEAKDGTLFGEGPQKVLDYVRRLGEEAGFFYTDYGVGVISLALQCNTPDLGIWIHADVVPEGDGWNFEPYNGSEYKDWVIGRGARDNKGSLVASFLALKMLKEAGIELKYNPTLYVGSDEELGMGDIIGDPERPGARGFLNVSTPPKLSLVPDSGVFPVGYCGKGGMKVILKSKKTLHGFSFNAGKEETPGLAVATFEREIYTPDSIGGYKAVKEGRTELSAYSEPRHASSPDPNGNMVTALSKILLDNKLVSKDDEEIVQFFKDVSLDIYGSMFHIATENAEMGPLTLCVLGIDDTDGYPEIRLNIRYPLGITYEEIVKNLERFSEERGFLLHKSVKGVLPYKLDKNSSIVRKITEISNEVTGKQSEPFIMSGGTYAHNLPNALVYGMDSGTPPTEFPKGRGYAHSIDEAASIKDLLKSVKIYVRARLALNEMDW